MFCEEDVRNTVGVGLNFQHVFRTQVVPIVQEIVNARGAIWIKPAVGQIRLVVRAHDTRVSCGDQSAFWIERLRELVEGAPKGVDEGV